MSDHTDDEAKTMYDNALEVRPDTQFPLATLFLGGFKAERQWSSSVSVQDFAGPVLCPCSQGS